MAIDKSRSPLWVKVVIILIAITFIGSVAMAGFGGCTPKAPTTAGTGAGGTNAATYQPQVDSALAASKSDPGNAQLLANVGHVYYEWAVKVYEGGAQDASRPIWTSAVAYYDQSLAINPKEPVVLGNKAFALTYAGSPDAQAALETFIATNEPTLKDQIENAKQLLKDVKSSSPATGSGGATGTP